MFDNSTASEDNLIHSRGEPTAGLLDVLRAHLHPLPVHRFLQLLHIWVRLLAGQTLHIGPEAIILELTH